MVLLLFALLSCCMLLPFTVVTTTRMDKSTDTFVQEHGLLNCLPCACIPSTHFPLSEIERIDVEDFDGPQFSDIGPGEDSASSSDDEKDMDEEERRLDEEDKKHFKEFRYIKPRSQVIVQTKYDSVPITAITSGLPSLIPFRDKRMTAKEIKRYLDRFLGFAVVDEEPEGQRAADRVGAMNVSSGQWEPASPTPEGGGVLEDATPRDSGGGTASSARPHGSGDRASARPSATGHAASAGGVYPSPARNDAQSHDESPPRSHAPAGAARSPAALSSGWKSAEGEGSTAAGSRADAEEMEVDDGMLEFVSFCQRRHTLA